MLRGHDPRQREADADQRPPAHPVWPHNACMPSRFLSEIPEDNMEWLSKPVPRSDAWEDSRDDDGCAYGYGGYTVRVPQHRRAARCLPCLVPARCIRPKRRQKRRPPPLHTAWAGETVEHDAFGRGPVLSVRPMGDDALLEVAFDTVGTKKLMLKAASHHLKKV